MSDSTKNGTLCERCRLLSFDDLALGGQEVVNKDGIARLRFPESRIESRPRSCPPELSFYRLVRLDWKVEDILPDMPRLSHSSQLGCPFCQALLRSLEDAFAKEARTGIIHDGALNLVAYLSLVDEGIGGLIVEATSPRSNQSWHDKRLEIQAFFHIEADSNCDKWLGAPPARVDSYLDSTNIGTIRQFLNHCTSKCHPWIPSPFMPTRLIDVGHDASDVPRLVLSSDICRTRQPKYAALSYCWGDEEDAESQFKTEKASLEHMCVSLPNELMTPTTNDAIAITRAIGLRYVWIDALCIIQDDKDDWSHESSQMNLVYRHAFVTFCSLNSNSCHESFLNRAPAVTVPFQSTLNKAVKGSYLIRLRSRTDVDLGCTKYRWDYSSSKWSNRCWTYQEQVMSTRLLLFGSFKVHFACATYQWSEGDKAPGRMSTSTTLDQVAKFKESRISARELYQCWDSLINNYGHRSVTFDKDRLSAIAGLARIVGEALQDQYLAGLWRRDLLEGLMWYSSSPTMARGLDVYLQNVRQRNYVAPSWSWAACQDVGSTRSSDQYLRRITHRATVVDVGVETDSENPYGQISGGFLRIRGKLAAMPTWVINKKRGKRDEWSNSWFQDLGPGFNCLYIVTDWMHKDKQAGLDLLVVMLLFEIEPDGETRAPDVRALLLHPADGSKRYYRVGTIRSKGPRGYELMANWFKDSQEDTICII